mgnify:CR=1 FL=1
MYARFGIMHGKSSGPLTESQRTVLDTLRTTYNMNQHTRGDSDQAGVLTPEFIDEYAIVGKPGHVIDRLRELQAMGGDKGILSGPRSGVDAAPEEARRWFESDVWRAVRGAACWAPRPDHGMAATSPSKAMQAMRRHPTGFSRWCSVQQQCLLYPEP